MKLFLPLLTTFLISGCIFSSTETKQPVLPDYGTELDSVIGYGNAVYYKSPVTEEEADAIYTYLRDNVGFFDSSVGGTVMQLTKRYSVYQVRFVIRDNVLVDASLISAFRRIAGFISNLPLEGRPVEIHLCDKNFNTLQIITI